MDDEQVTRRFEEIERELIQDAIDEVEQGLEHDDPDLVQRMHRLEHADLANALTVTMLVAVGAVLITVGLATLTWPAWLAGGLAFLASWAVDRHYHHTLG
jgi:Protein of unknown function (DUF3040)